MYTCVLTVHIECWVFLVARPIYMLIETNDIQLNIMYFIISKFWLEYFIILYVTSNIQLNAKYFIFPDSIILIWMVRKLLYVEFELLWNHCHWSFSSNRNLFEKSHFLSSYFVVVSVRYRLEWTFPDELNPQQIDEFHNSDHKILAKSIIWVNTKNG